MLRSFTQADIIQMHRLMPSTSVSKVVHSNAPWNMLANSVREWISGITHKMWSMYRMNVETYSQYQ